MTKRVNRVSFLASRRLGLATTRTFLAEKLQRPDTFNADVIGNQLDALERGAGKTYFEIVLEIIGDHHNIVLVPA